MQAPQPNGHNINGNYGLQGHGVSLEFPSNVETGIGQEARAQGGQRMVLAPGQRIVEEGSLVIQRREAQLMLALYGVSIVFLDKNPEARYLLGAITVAGYVAKSAYEYMNPSNATITDNNNMVTSWGFTNLIKILVVTGFFFDQKLYNLACSLLLSRLLGWAVLNVDVQQS